MPIWARVDENEGEWFGYKEVSKIFEPPFGLTPKILLSSLRLTKKRNQE